MSAPARSRPVTRRLGVLGAVFLCVVLGAGFILASRPQQRTHPAASAAATAISPSRLVVRARRFPVSGYLAGKTHIAGTLYPTLPGANTLHLRVTGSAGKRVTGGRLELVVTMPGMAMPPVRATLTARGDMYAGIVKLPMFGSYRAQITVKAPGARYGGAMILALPLTL